MLRQNRIQLITHTSLDPLWNSYEFSKEFPLRRLSCLPIARNHVATKKHATHIVGEPRQ